MAPVASYLVDEKTPKSSPYSLKFMLGLADSEASWAEAPPRSMEPVNIGKIIIFAISRRLNPLPCGLECFDFTLRDWMADLLDTFRGDWIRDYVDRDPGVPTLNLTWDNI